MNLLFQLALLLFIGVSFLLVVGVPIVFANGKSLSWKNSKTTLYTGISFWIFLVFIVGLLNSFVV
uniref:Photosystem II reaction center protein Z n=1 Tax=Boodleopsis sp. FL1161 TaxID=2364084 RepID=A0A386AZA6_9CHLO|nr:photosystem II protein Z [Boodleopsis sp. FL1161]